MRKLAFAVAGLLIAGSAAAKNADERALDAFSAAWRAAYQSGDFDRLRDLYEPDAWLMTRDQPARKGREAILAYFMASRSPDSKAAIAFDVENVVVDPPYAFKIARWRLESPKAVGEPFRDAGRSLVVFKKGVDGQWRLWRDIDNRTPDAPRDGWNLSARGANS
ncbi:MAG: SgcJ/EcaC family oxidoreductase [Parvularculaceae bacterium]|nr:SgcJ/EcaC family oxidoreductase [Parvularculaceae bacterium]